MSKPLQRFLTELIDYAGLFPPAQLPMDTAVANYARYRTSEDAWMMSRFICPASRLRELQPYRDNLFQSEAPFRFSVIGGGGRDRGQFLTRLKKDIENIRDFQLFHEGQIGVEIFETRLPEALLRKPDAAAITDFIKEITATFSKSELPPITLFLEAGFSGKWREAIAIVIKAIAAHNRLLGDSETLKSSPPAGFKLRCGGVEPQMYPTPEQVAASIECVQRFDVPLKATAGLHHPVRHFNKRENVKMHGFLNVFGAGILADAHALDEKEILEIVADENPKNFLFTRRAFAWKGLRASSEDIQRAREKRVISFGSCSFDEPREDLAAMKLL